MPSTTIKIDVEVREQLLALGRMGESYNDVIKRLLKGYRTSDTSRPTPRGPMQGEHAPVWMPLHDKR